MIPDTIPSFRFTPIFLLSAAFFCAVEARSDVGRVLTSGIIFPTLADAVAMNPAALTDESGATVGRLAYDDPTNGYVGMVAGASGTTGFGAALNAEGVGALTLGGGWDARFLRLGMDLSLTDTLDPSDGALGLGVLFGDASGLRAGFTMSSLLKSESNTLTAGVGYAQSKDYQLELDLSVPTSSISAAGQVYTQTLTGIKYFQSFGIGLFETSAAGVKPAGVASPDFGGVLQVKMGRTSVDLRYVTTAGGTFGFGLLAQF